ncbi:hypothetical protein COU78_06100 [Candidatus Peregrinibacteria bacterium CG10_big_fil_rev_8_21_14_0_10_49_24]|nr:MAG: hypothetical protein COV83_02935 [Candidatus Peregrinibacteria bacterium CG11_big_fil_rev_8_21_14_0_20_49_14]PIR50428.1 MAG: hypothetical protein COU78_06100 [Candidatus Peregrinibacteria bacterium CG10_big_fil_rev_8_21_14_0_10_49_24]PJA68264.1 MAG: hypothetical protein CO157_00090 [Candidatus Peregrinibacteria bacterium CG_4_9_14_3_um_filter_49_12]
MQELKPFIIFSHARSSSSRLVRTLQQHPQVHCAGEIFNDIAVYIQENDVLPIVGTTHEESRLPPHEFLWKFFQGAVAKTGKHTVGFKIFLPHVSQEVQEEWLRDTRIRKILLSRNNMLQASLSYELADHTQQYVRHPGQPYVKPQQFTVDTLKMHEWITESRQWLERCRRILRNTNQEYCECIYEDFSPTTTQEVFSFLGVPSMTDFKKYHTKMAEEDTYDCIENLNEVRAKLEGAQYGFLHEYIGEQVW